MTHSPSWPRINLKRRKPSDRFEPTGSVRTYGKALHEIEEERKKPKLSSKKFPNTYIVKGKFKSETEEATIVASSTETLKRPEEGPALQLSARHHSEAYAAWLYRLFIGNNVPKYTLIDEGKKLAAKRIPGFTDLDKIYLENPATFVTRFIEKLKQHNNLQAFIYILVCSLFFKENDLKDQHIGFGSDGKLYRIDFDNSLSNPKSYVSPEKSEKDSAPAKKSHSQKFKNYCFDLTAEDLESLPKLKHYQAYNFIYNYLNCAAHTRTSLLAPLTEELKKLNLKNLVYISLLKLLITPDWFTDSIAEIVHKTPRHDDFDFKKRRKELLKVVLKMPGFRAFLKTHATSAIDQIRDELLSFCAANSEFRKAVVGTDIKTLITRELQENYSKLFAHPLFAIEEFANQQIDRINRSWLTIGVTEKRNSFKKLVAAIQNCNFAEASKDQLELYTQRAMRHLMIICQHQRAPFSHLFSSESTSWTNWLRFCASSPTLPALSAKIATESNRVEWNSYYRNYESAPLQLDESVFGEEVISSVSSTEDDEDADASSQFDIRTRS